jgi:hypothetical protein
VAMRVSHDSLSVINSDLSTRNKLAGIPTLAHLLPYQCGPCEKIVKVVRKLLSEFRDSAEIFRNCRAFVYPKAES